MTPDQTQPWLRFAWPTEKNPERRSDRDLNLCQWWTPAWLARAMVSLAGIPRGAYVLEPCAGSGSLVEALVRAGAEVEAWEIDSFWAGSLRANGDAVRLFVGDYLSAPALTMGDEPAADYLYSWCVMNPPFDKSGTGDAFLVKALEECANVVALMRVNVFASQGRYESIWKRFGGRLKRAVFVPRRPDFADGEADFDGAISDFVVLVFDDKERAPHERLALWLHEHEWTPGA